MDTVTFQSDLPLDRLTGQQQRLFAADCAGHALDLHLPDNATAQQLRGYLSVVRQFANGQADAMAITHAKNGARSLLKVSQTWPATGIIWSVAWAATGWHIVPATRNRPERADPDKGWTDYLSAHWAAHEARWAAGRISAEAASSERLWQLARLYAVGVIR